MRQIKINSTLGNEILTAQNVKDFVRVDTSADDNIIAAMITQARIWCENYISRDIVPKIERIIWIQPTEFLTCHLDQLQALRK